MIRARIRRNPKVRTKDVPEVDPGVWKDQERRAQDARKRARRLTK